MADNNLSQEEVDALLKGVAGNPSENAEVKKTVSEVHVYNFTTQEHLVQSRMPTLEIINERFSRALRLGLFNFLQRNTEVSTGTINLSNYGEFIKKLAIPTNLNLVHIKPLRGTALIVIDPNLIFLLVDNLFGGDGRFHTQSEGRDFTQTEQRIILNILKVLFESYTKSWQPVFPIEFDYIRSETNTKFINIATENETVVCITFTIKLGAVSGDIHFCLPYAMIEPIQAKLASTMQDEKLETDKHWRSSLTRQIQLAEVEIVADLGISTMNLGDILNLQIGDVIPLSIPDFLRAKVDNVPVMECKYGIFNHQYALKVEKLLPPSALEGVMEPTIETKPGVFYG